ncbi:MAG: twin-arginine translocase TatA/TatE family subunit [Bdellovibrionales bacterium]|nr:twin-arginine translocase TatA/TatE family subunit [Bdellovibrionales bacterium]
MFNMGLSEMIILAVFALLVIGPKQLPEVARVIGRLLNDFKRATGDLSTTIADVKNQANYLKQKAEQTLREKVEAENPASPEQSPSAATEPAAKPTPDPDSKSEDQT